MIEEIIRRKKHNGITEIGDKTVLGRRKYQHLQYNVPNEYKNKFFYRLDEYGKYKKVNTSNYFNPSINMCGYGFGYRIKHLRNLFRQGKLMIGDLPASLKRKILRPY